MKLEQAALAGEYMCMVGPTGASYEWTFGCRGDYKHCLQFGDKYDRPIMIVHVIAVGKPVFTQSWKTTLGERVIEAAK